MQITTRSMTASDAEAITRLSGQLGYSISAEATLANIQTLLSLPDNHCLVAVSDSTVIGWIHAFVANRIESRSLVEIGGLVVDKNYRGQSVGGLLVNQIEEWCLLKNIPALRVRSNTKRAEARQFYTQLHFSANKEQTVFEKHLHKK